MADITRIKNRARREEQRENWSRAIELYTEALSESQKKGSSVADLSLYNRIGDIYLRIGQKNTAVRYYEEAIERYAEQELHASAIALCNKVLRVHPARSSVFLQLGRLHLATDLIADAAAHYHRFAESMWELGDEAAAFGGLEELIEQTGDARSVDVWVRWWSVAGDREAAEARLEGFRELVAAYDLDVDELLAQAGSTTEPHVPATDRVTSEGTARDPEETTESLSEFDSEEDAPPLPLLDPSPGEAEPWLEIESKEGGEPGSPSALPEAASAETTEDGDGAVPWEPEDEEPGSAGLDPDVSGVAVTDDWGSAVELSEAADTLPSRRTPEHSAPLDSRETGGRGPSASESGVVPSPRDDNESMVLHPNPGLETERPAAWYDTPEVGVGSDPPPPSHGGYATESVEHIAHPIESVREALRSRIDGCEASVSVGHPGLGERPAGEGAEPPTIRAHLAHSVARGMDLDSVEAVELALMGRESMPFEVEAGERSVDDEFPLHELLDRAEGLSADDPGAGHDSPAAGGPPFESEDPIDSAGVGGQSSERSAPRVPASLGAEPVEIDSAEPIEVEDALPAGGIDEPAEVPDSGTDADGEPVPTPAPGSGPEASEELESTDTAADALEEELQTVRSLGPQDLTVDESGSDSGFIALDEVPMDVEEVEWPAEPSPERAAGTEAGGGQPADDPTPSPTAAETASDDEPEPVPAEPERSVRSARTLSLEEAKRLLDAADPPRSPRDIEGAPGGGAIDVAPTLDGAREDAFREWVRSASPLVLRRALTELELRAELDKGSMVVERLLALDPDEPDLLQKRLEYAVALGDDAAVVETHVSLGQSLERAGRPLEARKAYESLLALDPDHAIAEEAVQRLQGVTDEYVKQEEGVAVAHPTESMHGPTAIGGVSGTSGYGNLTGGGALDAPDAKPLPYSGVAGGREAAADFEQLLSEFRAELHERPQQSDSTTRTELGASLKDMGRLDDAIRELQAAVREPQAPPLAYELLGEAFLDKGQARVAMRLLRQALQGSSWDEREILGVLYQLGVAYQELGESTNALGCYERIFSVDIDYKDVQERIVSCS